MPADSLTSVPLPDYEVEQHFSREHFGKSPEEVERLHQRYDCARTYFEHHPADYRGPQRWLNQTHVGTACGLYLAQSMKLTLVTAAFGSLVDLALTFVLTRTGVLANVSSPVSLDVTTGHVAPLAPYKVSILGATPVALVGGLVTAGTYYARYYLPKGRAEIHGRGIDVLLPHIIVYMYALNHGGTSSLEVIRSVADAPDYGKVSHEFEMIARDMDLFGSDLFTTLHNSRNLTLSINFEQFLDGLLSALNSGGDVTAFLDCESATYLEEARDGREDFIETLSALSEVFVAAFVAVPFLLIITLMAISFLGGDTLVQLYALNYLVFPLEMGLFLLLMDVPSSPYTQDAARTEHDVTTLEELRTVVVDFLGAIRHEAQRARKARRGGDGVISDDGFVDERLDNYRWEDAVYELRTFVGGPLDVMRRQPYLSAVATVPLALLSVVDILVLGLATPTLDVMLANLYSTMVWFVVLPFAVVAVPLTVFHELQTRHERTFERCFPDTLNLLSSADQTGISLVESLAPASRWSTGTFVDELRALHNDIRWNHDTHAVLMAFATRFNVPQLPRVIRLIANGDRASGNLLHVLSVTAEDTRNRYRLEKSHRRAMGSYIAIVVIGYFVYLFVVLMIGTSYLDPLIEMSVPTTASNGQSLPIGISSVPLTNSHVVFFHSTLIQTVGSGLLANKLADNSALNRLEYVLGLPALVLVTFVLV